MWRIPVTAVIAVLAIVFMLSMAGYEEASAESSKGSQTVKIPPGATVEINGKTGMIKGGGGGIAGSYDCSCSASGTCQMVNGGGLLLCVKGVGSCNGNCILTISTTGLRGVAPAAKGR